MLVINKLGSLLHFLCCGLADNSSETLRTVWILTMIMFCVSCVRISKHFKNMRTLLGEKEEQIDHISKGGLWSLGHAAFIQFYDLLCQTYGGTMISSFIVLFLKSMWSPFNSIYEVQ